MASQASPKLNLRRLKGFALERLPKGSALRDVILAEKDEIGIDEFLAKIDVWLKLLRRESS